MPFDPSTAKLVTPTPQVQVQTGGSGQQGFDPSTARLSSTVPESGPTPQQPQMDFGDDPSIAAVSADPQEAQRIGAAFFDPMASMVASVPQIASGALHTLGISDPYWLEKANQVYPEFKKYRKSLGSDNISKAAEFAGELVPLAFTGEAAGVGKLFGQTIKLIPRLVGNAAAGAASSALQYKGEGESRWRDALVGAGFGAALPEIMNAPINKLVASNAIKRVMNMAKSLANGFDEQSSKMSTLFQGEFQNRERTVSRQFKGIIQQGMKYLKPDDELALREALDKIGAKPGAIQKQADLIKDKLANLSKAPTSFKRSLKQALEYFDEEYAPFATSGALKNSRLAQFGLSGKASYKQAADEMLKVAGGDDQTKALDLYRFAPNALRQEIRKGLLQRALLKANSSGPLDPAKFASALDSAGAKIFFKGHEGENVIKNLESLVSTSAIARGFTEKKSGGLARTISHHPFLTVELLMGGGGLGYHEFGGLGGAGGAMIGVMVASTALHSMLDTEWGMRLLASTSHIKAGSPQAQRLVKLIISRTAAASGAAGSAGVNYFSPNNGSNTPAGQ